MAVLEKILRQQSDSKDVEEAKETQKGIGGYGNVTEPGIYEKIIAKLLEYNEKVNEGKEISVVDYLKRIDQDSEFWKSYET